MLPTSDVVWRPVATKRPVLRWVIAASAIITTIIWLRGGAPREPDIKLPGASPSSATQAAVPPRKPSTPPNVEPVRILNPAAQPAPRPQPDERINDVAARQLPARRGPADYQALRREMLTAD